MNYDCEGCGYFRVIMIRAKEEFEIIGKEICIDLPFCTYSANCLAIKRCDFFVLSEVRKEVRGKNEKTNRKSIR